MTYNERRIKELENVLNACDEDIDECDRQISDKWCCLVISEEIQSKIQFKCELCDLKNAKNDNIIQLIKAQTELNRRVPVWSPARNKCRVEKSLYAFSEKVTS